MSDTSAIEAYEWWGFREKGAPLVLVHAVVEDHGPAMPALGAGYDYWRHCTVLCVPREKTLQNRQDKTTVQQRCGNCLRTIEARRAK